MGVVALLTERYEQSGKIGKKIRPKERAKEVAVDIIKNLI